jgi:glycosyltransferase involved in cell wall biosynthesis
MIVNQWIPAAHRGDAVGDNARTLRQHFRDRGLASEVYALSVDDALRDDVRPWSHPEARDGDATILHFAIPSPMTAALGTLPGRRALCYHNITPPHYFAPFDPAIARLAWLGRQELATLVGRVDVAFGVSEYNREELDDLGFEDTLVVPLLVDTARLTDAPACPALERLLGDGLANILFVGRIAPNKKIEDHIKLAEHFKRYVDAYYRFIFVGRDDAVPRYGRAIRAMIQQFDVLPERFWFTGSVPDVELAAYYRHAHLYVSLSEHEGFCAPLVEAMAMDVPVLAYAAAAVPETLGGAGVSFDPKDLEVAAELAGELIYDEGLRGPTLAGQRKRRLDFSRDAIGPRIDGLLDALGARPATGASLA